MFPRLPESSAGSAPLVHEQQTGVRCVDALVRDHQRTGQRVAQVTADAEGRVVLVAGHAADRREPRADPRRTLRGADLERVDADRVADRVDVLGARVRLDQPGVLRGRRLPARRASPAARSPGRKGVPRSAASTPARRPALARTPVRGRTPPPRYRARRGPTGGARTGPSSRRRSRRRERGARAPGSPGP